MRGLLSLVSILSFLALLGSAGYYAFGFGLEYLQTTLETVEAQAEADAEAQFLGATSIDIEFTQSFYAKDFSGIAFKVDIDAGTFGQDEKYVVIKFSDLENYDEYTSTTFPDESFSDLSILLSDPIPVKTQAITYMTIFGLIWIGSIVVKVFFKKKTA